MSRHVSKFVGVQNMWISIEKIENFTNEIDEFFQMSNVE